MNFDDPAGRGRVVPDSNLAALQSVVDRMAIEAVLVDYCRHLDQMDLAALARLFTEDCDVRYGPDPALAARGRAALERSLARMWRWARTAHHLANVRIWLEDADRATAESAVHAWHERPDGSTATILGLYADALIRTPEGWRIQTRRMQMRGSDAGFTVPIPPAPRRPPPTDWIAPAGLDRPSLADPATKPVDTS